MNLLFLALFFFQQPFNPAVDYAAARLERRLEAVKATGRIEIDGALTEAAWASARAAANFTQSEPIEGGPASEPTEVRILYDNDNLYFGITAQDSEPDKIIINDLRKDFERFQGDHFDIVLDTFHDQRNGYIFSINPAGAKWDAQMGNEGRELNASWDGVWSVKAAVTNEGWVAEIAIPFKTLKFNTDAIQTFGLNFKRNIRRKNEEDYWSPLPRIYNIERVSYAGTLEQLEGIQPGMNLKIKPYFIASLSQRAGTRGLTNDGDGDFGLDAKYGLTSGLTWDFTYNTDFSQVEADTQQINLTRFNLFFPEKRDFFLENSGVFVFGSNEGRGPIGFFAAGGGFGSGGGGATGPGRQNSVTNDMILFFSRRIGLSDEGQAIPIAGGTRLTGRAGRFELGLLNIQQKRYLTSPAANFTVARVKRNILASSDIGVMLVNREQAGGRDNRAYGVDANFRLLTNYYLNGYVAKTSSPLTRGHGRDLAKRLSGGYKVDFWDFRISYVSIEENFRNEMGYVPRVGMRNLNTWIAFHFRPARLRKWIRELNFHDAFEYMLGQDGRLETRYFDHHFRTTFQSGASMEIGVNPSLERLVRPFRVNRDVTIPVGSYSFDEYFVSASSDPSRMISFNIRYGTGGFYNGDKDSVQSGATVRLNHQFSSSFSYARNDITLPRGKFDTNLFSLRANYSFTTAMFLNAFIQYNSDARQWSSNIRFNIIHRPLSDLFIVYNERRDSISGSLQDRALIAKLTYMVSR